MKRSTFIVRIISVFALMLFTLAANATATLSWATYFGGPGNENSAGGANSVCVDGSGNVFLSGYTQSTSAIATTGAYQTTYGGGGYDGYLAKFNSAGGMVWATYFGGSGDDRLLSINTDASGNVYVLGYTNSTSGIATVGAYMTTLAATAGHYNLFLAKFNSAGSLLWSTYFGGANGESAFGKLRVDGSGNVYITGTTASTSGIATAGSYQTTYGGGTGDAFLAKFSGTGSLFWSTYFGGSDDDNGNGVCIDPSGNVFICGRAYSTSGIATPGAYLTTMAGLNDVFIAKFTSSGAIMWATYYGGTDGDNARNIACDATGSIYITGYTFSLSGIATPGAFQTTRGSVNTPFLAKFTGTGSLAWGTYYGGFGSGSDVGWGVAVNSIGDVYMVGVTYSTTGIATPGSIQPTLGGTNDAFIVKFNSMGARQWGSYYGGTASDGGSEVATDAGGNVFFAGGTSSTAGITTPGAYQTVFGGGTGDALLASINDLTVAPITGTTSLCVGSSTTLSDATPGGTWSSSATGIATVGASTGIVSGIAAGTATITYTTGTGSATTVVTVNTAPAAPAISGPTSVCTGHTITLTGTSSGGTWASLSTSIATVGSSTGIVTGVTAGTAPIVYSVTNACGTGTATLNVTVTSGGPCTTKVKGKKESPPYYDAGLTVYPNPNNGAFTLTVGTAEDEAVQVVITNIMGQKVKELSLISNVATQQDMKLPGGIYIVVARTGSQTWFGRMIIE